MHFWTPVWIWNVCWFDRQSPGFNRNIFYLYSSCWWHECMNYSFVPQRRHASLRHALCHSCWWNQRKLPPNLFSYLAHCMFYCPTKQKCAAGWRITQMNQMKRRRCRPQLQKSFSCFRLSTASLQRHAYSDTQDSRCFTTAVNAIWQQVPRALNEPYLI